VTDKDRAIARRIAELREERHVKDPHATQEALSAKVGHGQSWWSGIESAKHRLSASDVGEAALALEVDVGLVIYGPPPAMNTALAEFLASIPHLARNLDERGLQTVMTAARQQVELAAQFPSAEPEPVLEAGGGFGVADTEQPAPAPRARGRRATG